MSYTYANALNDLLQTNSWRSLSKKIGISQSTLSKYISGSYEGNLEAIEERIKSYLAREAERGDKWRDLIVETETLSEIKNSITLIHNMRKMGVIYGPAGIGKTESARRYCEDTPGSIMVTVTPDCKTVAGVIYLIYRTLFKEELRTSPRQANVTIIKRLRGSDTILIVDDADEMTNEAFEQLRGIHDATDCPVAIIGTEMILNRLIHPRAGRVLARVHSRLPVKRFFPLQPSEDDVKKVCRAYGVTDKTVIQHLFRKSAQGGLRMAVHQIKIARILAKDQPVTLKFIIEAASIGGDLKE